VIASVSGRVAALGPESAVIEVGGFGVAVVCGPGTLAALAVGDRATLSTSLVVREDSLTLFGFADDDEREVFEQLQTVSGVGPRLAQAALAVHSPDAIRRAVAVEDLHALVQVPGIGRKGAQRLVLELKDKLGPPRGSGGGVGAATTDGSIVLPGSRSADWQGQVHRALLGLGWSPREADDAIAAVAGELTGADGETADIAVLLRSALRSLSRA
jgi:Holliday junction DNA helicase RuvA